MAEPESVPVRDLEVADRIAKAVRGGKPADRTPTIEQLVAAFGEAEPTLDARRRAARALALAGVAAVPDVLEAAPGQRLTLEVRHVRKRGALVGGILALVLLFAAVAAAATQLDFSDDNAASSLPADSTATRAHDGHQHGDAGADVERHDVDRGRRRPRRPRPRPSRRRRLPSAAARSASASAAPARRPPRPVAPRPAPPPGSASPRASTPRPRPSCASRATASSSSTAPSRARGPSARASCASTSAWARARG